MQKTDKPNVLFILADDLGWGDVSYHGSEIRTPNIDRLRDSGVELDQHYVCPMCTPTRVSLLTGRHPGRFGRHATTLSNLVGYTPKEDPQWDGVDIWPLINGQVTEPGPRSIFWNFTGSRFALRDGDWKLIADENMASGRSELYNIATDPYETHDAARDESDIVREMLNKIQQERKLDGSSKRNDVE